MSNVYPIFTATPANPPTYSVGMAETFSWIPIAGAERPLYSRAVYVTNLPNQYNGFIITNDTTPVYGNFSKIIIIHTSGNNVNTKYPVFASLSATNSTVPANIADVPFAEGLTIEGRITGYELVAGSAVMAYKA